MKIMRFSTLPVLFFLSAHASANPMSPTEHEYFVRATNAAVNGETRNHAFDGAIVVWVSSLGLKDMRNAQFSQTTQLDDSFGPSVTGTSQPHCRPNYETVSVDKEVQSIFAWSVSVQSGRPWTHRISNTYSVSDQTTPSGAKTVTIDFDKEVSDPQGNSEKVTSIGHGQMTAHGYSKISINFRQAIHHFTFSFSEEETYDGLIYYVPAGSSEVQKTTLATFLNDRTVLMSGTGTITSLGLVAPDPNGYSEEGLTAAERQACPAL